MNIKDIPSAPWEEIKGIDKPDGTWFRYKEDVTEEDIGNNLVLLIEQIPTTVYLYLIGNLDLSDMPAWVQEQEDYVPWKLTEVEQLGILVSNQEIDEFLEEYREINTELAYRLIPFERMQKIRGDIKRRMDFEKEKLFEEYGYIK